MPRWPAKDTRQPRPVHLGELCAECGPGLTPEGATHFACEHGSWDFAEFAEPEDEPPADPPAAG